MNGNNRESNRQQTIARTLTAGLCLVYGLCAGAAEPPRLIVPASDPLAVPPEPVPAPPISEPVELPATSEYQRESSPPPLPPPAEETPALRSPPVYNPNDPAMQKVNLHLAPLSAWSNLAEKSPTVTIDPRYAGPAPNQAGMTPQDIQPHDPPGDVQYLDTAGQGGIEHPYYAPVAPFCYYPLYFEEGCLERHGQSAGPYLQPVFSGVEFYARIGLLPVSMLFEKPRRKIMPLWPDPVDPAWEYGF